MMRRAFALGFFLLTGLLRATDPDLLGLVPPGTDTITLIRPAEFKGSPVAKELVDDSGYLLPQDAIKEVMVVSGGLGTSNYFELYFERASPHAVASRRQATDRVRHVGDLEIRVSLETDRHRGHTAIVGDSLIIHGDPIAFQQTLALLEKGDAKPFDRQVTARLALLREKAPILFWFQLAKYLDDHSDAQETLQRAKAVDTLVSEIYWAIRLDGDTFGFDLYLLAVSSQGAPPLDERVRRVIRHGAESSELDTPVGALLGSLHEHSSAKYEVKLQGLEVRVTSRLSAESLEQLQEILDRQ